MEIITKFFQPIRKSITTPLVFFIFIIGCFYNKKTVKIINDCNLEIAKQIVLKEYKEYNKKDTIQINEDSSFIVINIIPHKIYIQQGDYVNVNLGGGASYIIDKNTCKIKSIKKYQ